SSAASSSSTSSVGVSVRGRPTLEVAEELAALDEVCAVNLVSGEYDLEMLILSADHETLREFVSSRVSSIRGIESLTPALGLELFKFENMWSTL
ncbi:MAG TPA: Lrp/AsnC ligand binding domain-containing protein, partial [Myxococcota bacterium]|nr:Lrp/AsnC ligand binding domain-containing protein [Myxococcota bacterium]